MNKQSNSLVNLIAVLVALDIPYTRGHKVKRSNQKKYVAVKQKLHFIITLNFF